MRRDDAKKIIAALIRRRHNDALRIKKLRKRLNDNINPSILDRILLGAAIEAKQMPEGEGNWLSNSIQKISARDPKNAINRIEAIENMFWERANNNSRNYDLYRKIYNKLKAIKRALLRPY